MIPAKGIADTDRLTFWIGVEALLNPFDPLTVDKPAWERARTAHRHANPWLEEHYEEED